MTHRDAKPVLSPRQLAGMTLQRQHLLAPALLSDIGLAEHLVGLQAQNPWSWYTGFFRRAVNVTPDQPSVHLGDRSLVRMSAMRATIHLMTPKDAATLRAHTETVHERTLISSFGRELRDINLDAVTAYARDLLETQPHTLKELGSELSPRWPNTRPGALAMVARFRLPLVQIPPRAQWRQSGPIAYTTLSAWTGHQSEPTEPIEQIVLRYLKAFGPASVLDFQTWSGLTKCRTYFNALSEQLVTYSTEQGQVLYDVHDSPGPDVNLEEMPPRLLYDYDNLLLSYKDRTRFVTQRYVEMQRELDGTTLQAVLLNGRTVGMWTHQTESNTTGVEISPFEQLSPTQLDKIEEEARLLGRWLSPGHAPQITFQQR